MQDVLCRIIAMPPSVLIPDHPPVTARVNQYPGVNAHLMSLLQAREDGALYEAFHTQYLVQQRLFLTFPLSAP
jgi:hypothetical protein